MNTDKKLDLLKQIKEVEAPPFLFTRIKQQIQNTDITEAPVKWKWAFGLASLVIIILNTYTLFMSNTSSTKIDAGVESIVKEMNLSTQNDLYYE